MRYLCKSTDSEVLAQGWAYMNPGQRLRIREALIKEQHGYCAYSERYLRPTDAAEIEHFDPRDKNTPQDGYGNWYVVLRWMNLHKPRAIEPFLPILHPADAALQKRVSFRHGQFLPTDEGDVQAANLIRWLGWNRRELVEERENHISRHKRLRQHLSPEDWRGLLKDPSLREYITAMEAEFGSLDVA